MKRELFKTNFHHEHRRLGSRHILGLLKVENFWSQNIVRRNMEQVDYYIFVQNLKNKD